MNSVQSRASQLLNASIEGTNPASPPTLELIDASNGKFHISWNIYDDGEYEINNYIVGVINTATDSDQSFTYEVNGSVIELVINNDLVPTTRDGSPIELLAGETYAIYVVGVNSVGSTPLSNALEQQFTLSVPPVPSISSYNVGIDSSLNLVINPSGTTSPSDGPVSYDIRIHNDIEILEIMSITSTTSSIRGLSQGYSYDVIVRASNNMGSSAFSSPITVSVPNAPPDSDEYQTLSPPILEAKAYDSKITTFLSDEPSNSSSYILKLKDLSTSKIYLHTFSGEEFTLTGLINDNRYEVSVMKLDSTGVSDYSVPVPLTPQKTPDPVTSLDAIFCGDGVIHVFYQYPGAVPGHTYSFVLIAYNESDPSASPVSSGYISGLDYKFLDLVHQDVYTITIQVFDETTNDASNIVTAGDNIIATSIGCLLEGTRLLKGGNTWVLIEEVKIGDLLWSPLTKQVAKVTRVFKQVLPVHPKTLPICLKKEDHRFQLQRDLFLSPMHALYLQGKFFEAYQLPFLESVSVQTKNITYYNIELEGCRDPFKYTLCAEGLTVESQGDRNSIGRDGIAYHYEEECSVASTC